MTSSVWNIGNNENEVLFMHYVMNKRLQVVCMTVHAHKWTVSQHKFAWQSALHSIFLEPRIISRFALPPTAYTTPQTETHFPPIVGRHPQKHYPGYLPRKLGPTPMRPMTHGSSGETRLPQRPGPWNRETRRLAIGILASPRVLNTGM